MCDYSLEALKSRKAEVGDKLVISHVHGFVTEEMARHMATINRQPNWLATICVTCLEPGTRLDLTLHGQTYRNVEFVQLPRQHNGMRDHVVLPGHNPMSVSSLPHGTTATVLSIPGVITGNDGLAVIVKALDEQQRTGEPSAANGGGAHVSEPHKQTGERANQPADYVPAK